MVHVAELSCGLPCQQHETGEGENRGTRGSIPALPTGSDPATLLHPSIHVLTLPATASPASPPPARPIVPPPPPPPQPMHTAVAHPPYLYSSYNFHQPRQLQHSIYPHRLYPGPYASWPLPYPMLLGSQSDPSTVALSTSPPSIVGDSSSVVSSSVANHSPANEPKRTDP